MPATRDRVVTLEPWSRRVVSGVVYTRRIVAPVMRGRLDCLETSAREAREFAQVLRTSPRGTLRKRRSRWFD
jgi:hypothetical protein